ncbi:MAG: GGDEF domain-containing protein [Proteobacteria bacterium]|nr:GGDEF domain-containing protein [Pseudomonadota bacterium]
MFNKKKEQTDLGRPYVNGEIIAKQDQSKGVLYVIQGGKVQVVFESEYGMEELEVLGAGSMFGAVSLITEKPYPASYVAQEDVQLISIDNDLFVRRLHEDPSFCYNLIEQLANDVLALRRELDNQSVKDSLTNAYIRQKFNELFNREVQRATRNKNNLALALFEIDGCMEIIENRGYQRGNELISETASLILKIVRTPDILIRWSGNQFMIILPDTNLAQAFQAGERHRIAVEESFKDAEFTTTISIGVTSVHANDTPESVIERATFALNTSREKGGNLTLMCETENACLGVEDLPEAAE